VLKQHPVTGVGPGNFREYYQTTLPEDIHPRFIFPHAHNDPLHIATVGGVPAALIWLLLWLAVLILAWRGLHLHDPHRPAAPAYSVALLTGSLMFLMTSLTEATFFDDEVRQFAMFIWALGLADWYNRQSPHQGAGKTT
jgi:O-antigen ligase